VHHRSFDERDAQLARGESMGWMYGMPQGDFSVLRLAHAYEQVSQDVIQRAPIQQAR
jgi:hypothetical protein